VSRLTIHTFMFVPSATYMYRWSCENSMSHTDPAPRVSFATNTSRTNVPSLRKIWKRLLDRSQTYTRPSRAIRRQ